MTASNQHPGATSTFGPTCRRVAVALLLTGTLVLCSGCLLDVHRVVSSPGATGIVLDANTAEPIARAQVAVARYCPPAAAEPFDDPITVSNALHFVRWPRVKTDQAGSFSVPPKHKLIAIILFGDYFGRASGSLVVQHPGYQTKVIPISVLVPIEVATNGYGRKVLLNRIRK